MPLTQRVDRIPGKDEMERYIREFCGAAEIANDEHGRARATEALSQADAARRARQGSAATSGVSYTKAELAAMSPETMRREQSAIDFALCHGRVANFKVAAAEPTLEAMFTKSQLEGMSQKQMRELWPEIERALEDGLIDYSK